jgi:F0F1-type ATP synthase membrane subunit c/vacuolar-type H+-ATPase subunit K
MMLPLLAEMTGSIHVGLAAMGVGIGIGLTGMGMANAVGRNPGAFTPILVHGRSCSTLSFFLLIKILGNGGDCRCV